MARILNLDPYEYSAAAQDTLSEAGTLEGMRLDRAGLLERIGDYDALIMRFAHRMDSEILGRATRLKVIGTNATGVDHIDEAAAAQRNIALVCLRGETAFLQDVSATAEHTWGLLLALVRNLVPATRSVQSGVWSRELFLGGELAGKRLGIIGHGRLGRMVAKFGLAFGMNVRVFDTAPVAVEAPVQAAASLEDLIAGSHVLSMHASLTESSRDMLTLERLSLLPKGALLINTARGVLIDETAVLTLLDSGHLGGAALDVLHNELAPGFPAQSALVAATARHPNLIITPHIGGATRESWAKTELFIARKVRDVLMKGMERA